MDLDSIKCEIENERKIKEEVDEYNRKKNSLESEILNIQTQISSLPTAPQKKVSKSLIGGVSALAVALLTAIILLGVFKIFELAGTIAIVLVIVIGYVVAITLLAKRPTTTPVKDDGKAKLLSQKQAEYQKYSEEKIYDESKLQSLQMQYYTIDKELSIKNEKQRSFEREITELTIEYEEVVDELERQKEKSVNAQNSIKLLTKTLQFMETAQTRVSQRYIEPMQISFNKYFSALADKNITLNVNFDALERTNLGDKEFEYLSQGYQDIVSICRRIALIEKIYEKEKPVLILDDPFVNLDDKKLDIMKGLIKDLSKSYQVFYFYCHKKSSIEI